MDENTKVILWMTALNTAFWVGLHFGVGALITRFAPAKLFDCRRPFYCPHGFERNLYRTLRVARWKSLLPTYGTFDKRHLKSITPNYLAQFAEETCRAEVIHWCIGILGFSSVGFAFLLEDPKTYLPLFLSIAAVLFATQLPFIFIQRFNRPRLLRLIDILDDGR